MTSPDVDALTVDEIAQHLRTSRWSVGRAVKAGQLAAIRVPGKGRDGSKRIPRASYLDFLERSTVAAQPPEDHSMTDSQPASALPNLHLFEDVAVAYRIPIGELKKLAYGENPKIEHIHIGTRRYFTDDQLRTFLTDRTRKASKADDGLDGVRARRARRKAKATAAATPRRRSAA